MKTALSMRAEPEPFAVSVSPEQQLRSRLLAAGPDQPNKYWIAHIVSTQRCSGNALPLHLGLEPEAFRQLINRFFPGCPFWQALQDGHDLVLQRGELRQQLLELRREEWGSLRDLLLQHRRGVDDSEIWMADVVAAACLGSGHLWRDLGLASRGMLRELLLFNFPALTLLNVNDMRWKKFFYKQLCEQEGGYVCRAPTCGQCATYSECYGEES